MSSQMKKDAPKIIVVQFKSYFHPKEAFPSLCSVPNITRGDPDSSFQPLGSQREVFFNLLAVLRVAIVFCLS